MVSKSRVWKFRLGAILVGLLPWFMAELALRAIDFPAQKQADPYVDLKNLQPLFQPASDSAFLQIGSERLNWFSQVSFRKAKPADTFRVFALGGSTTYGEPYRSDTAFPKWLELNLQAAAPGKKIEVINCGGLSYASYRVLAILREVLSYDPDLIVIYTGHNEYLEQRTYGSDQEQGGLWGNLTIALNRLHTLQLLRSTLSRPADEAIADRNREKLRTEMLAEVDALLDYAGGLEDYHRDAKWREPVVEHFGWNLQQMCRVSKSADVPLVLVKPVANLVDCPPIKMETDPNLSETQRREFESLWEQCKTTGNPKQALELLDQALAIDAQHAGANYLLGKLSFAQGNVERARTHLNLAKDWDVCPLRATEAIQQVVVDVARTAQVPMLDAQELFSELSDGELVGQRWLVDHIHPNLEGHQKLGEALAELLIGGRSKSSNHLELDPGVLSNPSWRDTRRTLYEMHLDSLGEAYYQRGKQRLEGLLLWTQGRAKKLRPSTENSTSE